MPLLRIQGIEQLLALAGQELGASGWLEITQDRMNAFADASLDHQWIHVDVERARCESPYGVTIAHGFFTLSLVSELRRQVFEFEGPYRYAVNYGLNRVRFPAPVPAGSRIRGRFTLQSVEVLESAVALVLLVTVEVEGGSKPALVAEWLLRYYR
jgi:acyl dehydratase